MNWVLIRIVETTTFMSKAHSLKSPGSDQLQNYWLKALPAADRNITIKTGNVRTNVIFWRVCEALLLWKSGKYYIF